MAEEKDGQMIVTESDYMDLADELPTEMEEEKQDHDM